MAKVPYPYEVNVKLVTGNGSLIPICSLSNRSLLPNLTVVNKLDYYTYGMLIQPRKSCRLSILEWLYGHKLLYLHSFRFHVLTIILKMWIGKGQLNSEWIYEFIISPKMQTKNYKDFCPTIQTRIIALFLVIFWWVYAVCFGYDPCLVGRAEILTIFGWHFGRNDNIINSVWI